MSDLVIDASALLALINGEPGAEQVAEAVPGAAISAVNLSEVAARLAENGADPYDVRQEIDRLALDVVPFDAEQAYETAWLRPDTKALGLSLGDRACIQLGRRMARPVLTADRVWSQIPSSFPIQLIR